MASRLHSPLEIPATAKDVSRYLASVLPGSRLTNEPVHSSYDPLILLYTPSVMAAFAFSNGDTNKSFDLLYGNFKKFYAQNGSSNTLDVAFVFCVHPDARNLDLLCSRVETDVYFCRKFVIRLVSPVNKSLARLPFLPLSPLGTQSLRPPSAQTYLQRCGVTATLAKFLVVQRERSPARIVDDCLSGVFGEPRALTPTSSEPITTIERTASPVRFESISIADFRAYRTPRTFRFGSNVTVLYGPNGFGKTSLFDAIDFAVTGDIGRLNSSSDSHFKKIAKHLDSGPHDGIVELSFRSNGAVRKLERRVDNRKQAKLDGQLADRKKILRELTSGEFPSADRIENFVSLFRATHLFSQEHQELMNEFHNDCELSARIVSRLLAFEDYTNAGNKITKVLEILQSAIDSADRQVSDLSIQVSDEGKEIARLSRTVEAPRTTHELRDAIASLRTAVSEAGFSVSTDGSDLDTVRGWRTAIEIRQAIAQTQIERLSALAKDVANRPNIIAELSRTAAQIERAEAALERQRQTHSASVEELRQAKLQQDKVATTRATIQERSRIVVWVRTTIPTYTELMKRVRVFTKELEGTNATLTSKRQFETDAVKELQPIEKGMKEPESANKMARARHKWMQELDDTAPTWETAKTRLDVIAKEERQLHGLVKLLQKQESDLVSKQLEVLATEARLARQIADADQGQSELRQILLQLKDRVHDGTCPLCGEDHGSTDVLLQHIDQRIVADAANAVRVELREVRDNLASVSEQLANCKSRRTATDRELERIAAERKELGLAVQKFEELARQMDVPIGDTTILYVKQHRAALQEEIENRRQKVEELNERVRTNRAKVEHIAEEIEQVESRRSEAAASLQAIQDQLGLLRQDPRSGRVSLDIDPDQLRELGRRVGEEATAISAELEAADNIVAQTSAELAGIRKEGSLRQTELDGLRNRVAQLKGEIAELDARLEEADLRPEVMESTLLSEIATESHAQAECLKLRGRALGLELAIDRSTTAAALSQLRQNLQDKKQLVAAAKQKGARYPSWLKYFGVLAKLISNQRNEATQDFTREYGPRTSVIQRRLRSVYGFDDVEIRSHDSSIRVRVKRRDEELRPTDYFSQSQQQTLLLGLFLATCLSQTWSSLCPVLLDDPVTNFDDLNAYAFLDLVSGLVESEPEGRQFIVSTCDEKFLQLARQKFGHLEDRAAFYTFSAIDENGPAVDMLASSNATTPA